MAEVGPYTNNAEANSIAQSVIVSYLPIFNDYIKKAVITGYQGTIDLSSPAPTKPGLYVATQTGTYTNYGGLAVDLSKGENRIYVNNDLTSKLIIISLDPTAYVATSDLTIINGSKNLYDGTVTEGAFVNYDSGYFQQANCSISSEVAIKPSTDFYISGRSTAFGVNGYILLDASHKQIYISPSSTPPNGKYTSTANTAYLRFTTKYNGNGSPDGIMVSYDNSPYEPSAFVYSKIKQKDIASKYIINQSGAAVLASSVVSVFGSGGSATANIYDGSYVDNYFVNYDSGYFAQSGARITAPIPILGGIDFYIFGRVEDFGSNGILFRDAAGNQISFIGQDAAYNGKFTSPANAAFMQATLRYNTTGTDPSKLVVSYQPVTAYVAYQATIKTINGKALEATNIVTSQGSINATSFVQQQIKAANISLVSKRKGQKGLFFGHSFVDYDIYATATANALQLGSFVRNGVPGSCVVPGIHPNHNPDWPSGVSRIDSALTGTYDFILIDILTNDYGYNAPIGTINDPYNYTIVNNSVTGYPSQNTLYAAYQYMISQAVKAMPGKVFVVGMMQRYDDRTNYQAQLNYDNVSKDICARYSVPRLDLMREGGMTYENISYFTSDKTHPDTAAGKAQMLNLITTFLNRV